MAVGDDALNAGMQIMTGTELANTLDTEVNLTRDYIAQRTSAVTPIAKGGTGATSASAARTALGLSAANTPSNGVLGTGNGTNNLQADIEYLWTTKLTKTAGQYNADLAYRDALITDRVAKSGDTMTGHLFLPNA